MRPRNWIFLVFASVISLAVIYMIYKGIYLGPRSAPKVMAQKENNLELVAPKNERANACFFILCRNTDIEGISGSVREIEEVFNSRYNYPYVVVNNEEFTEEFKEKFRKLTKAPVEFGLIPKEHWSMPEYIDEKKCEECRNDLERRHIIYGGSLSYRFMCRYFSGYFFRHPLAEKYEYYWRIEPGIHYYCYIDFDPFLFLKQTGRLYGYNISIKEYGETVPTLWNTIKRFLNENPTFMDKDANFLSRMRSDDKDEYNMCHFWSNFEIASFSIWRDERYLKFFDYLDRAGGFFYERWGDAPVHSLALSIMLDINKIHFFDEIGYEHPGAMHCPNIASLHSLCRCNHQNSVDYGGWSCLLKFQH